MLMQYDRGKHCVFYHRYHLVWSTKYRYKVLLGDVRLRVRDIIRQVCAQNDVDIIRGAVLRKRASRQAIAAVQV
jgi:putative transposase